MTHLFLKESKRKFKVLQLNLVCISSLQRSYFPSQLPGMTRRLTPNIADSKKHVPSRCGADDHFLLKLNKGNTSA